ncbi:MAG: NosD domain-containing protein [Rhodothermales bacterium]|nr:NosD domain-containing protein [Rhodothermales bacterium]
MPASHKIPLLIAASLTLFCSPAVAQNLLHLEADLVITSSVTVAPGEYYLPADSLGAIRIEGDSITVDFNGAILNGALPGAAPDTFEGSGVFVAGGRGVTIKNAVVRGYKVGLIARDADQLTIDGGDFSYNYRQRLKSTIEREHLDDWMSYHINNADEWLGYGAAIYLNRCERPTIRGVTVTGGQNGIMLTDVNHGLLEDNAITFNSAIGIGMYRSSHNVVLHNRLDWNVRGYSQGVYYRGQDSAAILLYEQSSHNTIAYNSATHSGDGLFLWAGQTTMDDGSGGSNDNRIVGNDFSFAPTNCIEVTFSRNTILDNYLEGCWHGIWGGYSFDTVIAGNTFVDNDEHIAIEHGQNITIADNTFSGGKLGIYAWERASQPADWGYARHRDTRSRDYAVHRNTFAGVAEPLRILNTDPVSERDNRIISGIQRASTETASALPAWPDALPRGRRFMMIDVWGPYDFRSPVLWPRHPRIGVRQVFDIHGPAGTWRIADMAGIDSVSAMSGSMPDSVVVWRTTGDVVDMTLALEYMGETVVDRFGAVTPAGTPYVHTYRHFRAAITWRVDFFAYDATTDPRTQPDAFRALIAGAPLFTDRPTDLGYQWYGSPGNGLTANQFATVSTGTFEVPTGSYILDLTSDDGVRVWLDGRLIHDDWTYHPPKLERIELELGGRHELRIEHFEIDGYATLVATLEKATP